MQAFGFGVSENGGNPTIQDVICESSSSSCLIGLTDIHFDPNAGPLEKRLFNVEEKLDRKSVV